MHRRGIRLDARSALVIAALTRRWQMQLAPGTRIKLEPQLTLRSRYGMPMNLEKRQSLRS